MYSAGMKMGAIISHMLSERAVDPSATGKQLLSYLLEHSIAFLPAPSCSAVTMNYSKEIYLIFPLFEFYKS